jgi:protein-disulfide isomerase
VARSFMTQFVSALNVLGSVSMVAVAGFLAWTFLSSHAAGGSRQVGTADVPTEPIAIGEVPQLGDAAARVVIIEYSEFQCPYCAKFSAGSMRDIDVAYVKTGKVLLLFKNLPLKIHPFAFIAAQGAMCAHSQGQFWPMHDSLFADQRDLDRPSLVRRAAQLGLDQSKFVSCLDAKSVEARVQEDRVDAARLGILGTPAFIIGLRLPDGRVKARERLNGALPFSQFQQALERVLADAGQPH